MNELQRVPVRVAPPVRVCVSSFPLAQFVSRLQIEIEHKKTTHDKASEQHQGTTTKIQQNKFTTGFPKLSFHTTLQQQITPRS